MPTRSVPAFLAIMGLLAGGCGGEPPPNLLLIVVDTLRADHLGAYGHGRRTSPELDAFARDAVRFERAYATAPWTQPSVASILTGLAPAPWVAGASPVRIEATDGWVQGAVA